MPNKQMQTNLSEPIPEWKLRVAYFFTENKVAIKRASVFMLFFADVVIVFLFGSFLVNYETGKINEYNTLNALSLNLVNPHALKQHKQKDLILDNVRVVTGENSKNNYMIEVENLNSDWALTSIDYTFLVNGKQLEKRTGFVLPNSSKKLMYFNSSEIGNAEFQILDSNWERIKDYSLLSYKDKVQVVSSKFTSSSSGKLSGSLEFEIFNDSPYSFWEVGLPIILYNNRFEPIAIDYIIINKLLSQERRDIEISWHEPIRDYVSKIDITPEINLLDSDNIIDLESLPGSPPGRE